MIMAVVTHAEEFLSRYPVYKLALELRQVVLSHLPGVKEEVDLPARMVMYTYGPGYKDMVCAIIPSQKGLKLGFYKGTGLADPEGLLEGTGKISRYVSIPTEKVLRSRALVDLLQTAHAAYRLRKG